MRLAPAHIELGDLAGPEVSRYSSFYACLLAPAPPAGVGSPSAQRACRYFGGCVAPGAFALYVEIVDSSRAGGVEMLAQDCVSDGSLAALLDLLAEIAAARIGEHRELDDAA